jgi:putative acetyltransferase
VRTERTPLTSGAFAIRAARPSDARGMRDLVAAVAREGRYIRSTEARPLAVYRRRARRSWTEDGAELVAVADGRVVGGVRVVREQHAATRHVASFGLLVLAEQRGRGIGRALLAEVIRWAEHVGIRKLELAVYPDNEAAIALYRAAGFVEEGRLRGHSRRREGFADEVLMGRWLGEDA